MRFYLGFSKRIKIKTIIQILGFLFVALCAFFGIDNITAHALTNANPNGSGVYAYKPLYGRDPAFPSDAGYDVSTGGCTTTNPSGCVEKPNLYNTSSCNNKTYNGNNYCMFANHNSNDYFSTAAYIQNGNNYSFSPYYKVAYGYFPHSKLVWKWSQSSVNFCSSGNLTLYYKFLWSSNNSAINSNNMCAFNLGSITGSFGQCSNYITVNGNDYQGSALGNGAWSVNIPKPTTDLTITIDDIQPFLATFTPEGQTTINGTWNYGFAITGYECSSSSSNVDTNAIINNASQNTQSIINNNNSNTNSINNNINNSASAIVDNQNENTQSINDNISESASAIVDSIDDLKDNQDSNTQSIIDSIENGVSSIVESNEICKEVQIAVPVPGTFRGNLNSDTGAFESSSSSNMYTTDFIRYYKGEITEISSSPYTSPKICYYNKNKEYISCKRIDLSNSLNVPQNTYYFRFSYRKEGKPVLSAIQCGNGTQMIYDSINDDSIPNIGINDSFVSNNENSTIQNLAMYPVNLINKILDATDNSGSGGGSSFACTPLSINLSSITRTWGGFDYTLELPCFTHKAKELIGNEWFNIFDLLIASMLFYYFALHLVERFELFTDGVDMFPGFFTNHIKQQYVDERTGEVSYR